MATEQIAIRLTQELLSQLDELVAEGVYQSHTAAVRDAVKTMTQQHRRRRIDDDIIDGYTMIPPSVAEDEAARRSMRDAIAEEQLPV